MSKESSDQEETYIPSVLKLSVVGISTIAVGTVFYHVIEKLSYLDALYFSVITLTTIGYGDIAPTTSIGKLFTIFYVLIGIGLLAGIANILLKHAVVKRMKKNGKID
jgi:voltage-gated potassium channel